MPQSQRDVRHRIAAVRNIEKITRAMAMVAAARLRRSEQRIRALRPYASAIRRMTRQAAEAAGPVPNVPILQEHAEVRRVGLLLVAGDRGLAGAFNSNIVRAGIAVGREYEADGREVAYFASGRRVASSLTFRRLDPVASFIGFTDRPGYSDARRIAERLMAAYLDGEVDQVEVFYNGYLSAISQVVRRETLLPLQRATVLEAEPTGEPPAGETPPRRVVPEYEPDPAAVLRRLVPDYVEISIYRALLESTASEHGARMTAMRQASDNATELIDELTLQMNRARQAEITQEIMEVVAGAEGLR
ncbi:MAG TPA: ATP synthase F1 subunit gamma [Acidimicrobiales bacterium]|nr:ATP synthase F1 subunit gamma [Acidimicrobiales bacterium]